MVQLAAAGYYYCSRCGAWTLIKCTKPAELHYSYKISTIFSTRERLGSLLNQYFLGADNCGYKVVGAGFSPLKPHWWHFRKSCALKFPRVHQRTTPPPLDTWLWLHVRRTEFQVPPAFSANSSNLTPAPLPHSTMQHQVEKVAINFSTSCVLKWAWNFILGNVRWNSHVCQLATISMNRAS